MAKKPSWPNLVLKADSVLPGHTHPHEQTGYLVMGHIRLTIGGKEHDV